MSMASNSMKTREGVLNILQRSLREEHLQKIQQLYPQYECQDNDDVADDFLCYLEQEEKIICFKSNIFYKLVEILQYVGLGHVVNELPIVEFSDEDYNLLKKKIIENFDVKECKKRYFKQFKQNVVKVYGLQMDDVEVCGFTEIIQDLENDGHLSRYSFDRFQDVFKRSGCQEIVDLINEAKKMPVEEEAMDTTDARAVTTSYEQTGQSTQEQNQGTSRQSTFAMGTGEHTTTQTANQGCHQIAQELHQGASTSNTFQQGSQGRQTQATFSTGHAIPAGTGFHPQTQPQATFQQPPAFQASHQPSNFQSPTETQSHGTMFSANTIGTNINIAAGSKISTLNITTGNQGQDATFSGHMRQDPQYDNPNNSFSGHVRQNAPYSHPQNPPGFLPDEALAYICQNLGTDWKMFGLKLKIDWTTIDKMHAECRDLNSAIMKMLTQWRNQRKPSENQLEIMCKALNSHGNSLLAGKLRQYMRT